MEHYTIMSEDLERFDPATHKGRIFYEHLHRYALCREWVEGLRVLDIACGTGYGTAILGTAAASVTGVDISQGSVIEARRRYGNKNVQYVVGDCYDLPFDDDSFDVVVANEMIEHVENHDGLINEVKRVLRAGGRFLISTPNKPVYNRYKPPNIFHISEMDINGFETLLRGHFPHVRMIATRMLLSSVSFDLERRINVDNQSAALIYNAQTGGNRTIWIKNEPLDLNDPEYILAACSLEPLDEHFPKTSLLFSSDNDLWLEHEKIMAWASGLHDEDEVLRADLAAARTQAHEHSAQLSEMHTAHAEAEARLQQAQRQISDVLTERERLLEQARRDVDKDWAALARYIELLVEAEVGAEIPELLKGLYALNERHQRMLGELSAIHEHVEAHQRADDLELAASRQANLQDQQLKHQQHEQAVRELERKIAEIEGRYAVVSNELRVERSRVRANEERLNSVLVKRDKLQFSLDAVQTREQKLDETIQETLRNAAQKEIQVKLAHELAVANFEAAQEKLKAATQAHNAALATIQTKQEMLNAAQARIERTDNALQTLRVRHEEIAGEHEATQAALDQARSALTARTAQLAPRLGQLRDKLLEKFPKRQLLSARETRNRDEFRTLHRNVRNELAQALKEVKSKAMPAPEPRSRQLVGVPVPGSLRTCLFSRGWVARNHPELGTLSLWSYLKSSQYWGIDPHPLFDATQYREKRHTLDGREVSPLLHYIEQGWRESRDPHPWFCNDWYLYRNLDVLADGSMSPLEHYLLHGWKEGRKPSPLFDPVAYLDRYPDVRAADIEPLTHFIVHGLPEGREVPIRGVTANSRLWLPENQRNRPVLDFLLACDVPEDEPQFDVDKLLSDFRDLETIIKGDDEPGELGADISNATAILSPAAIAWPPRPLNDYWPPQGLRNFVLERYDEMVLDRIWYLYSVMAAFEEEANKFPASEACSLLVEHARSRAGSVRRNTSGVPDVSIVIPVYNNILDTLLCIVSVLDAETIHSFEIIVADDCSTDATATLIQSIGGCVRHVRHAKNEGFLGNCNAAAAYAEGHYVLLLNNDTLVMPRWLDALLEPFDRFERVGLTGAKLINWDGSLQEAGGIYWKDGSAWNFGRNQAPRAPQFSYLKDVDYVSGAAICIPRDVWRAMDGFDTLFTPAYCEDSDLAFRLRATGYRTLLTPEAEVIHHEGRSHGRDVESGVKAYQVTNTERLLERWRDVLERDHYPNAVNVLRARDRSFNKRHILVVDHYVPQWDQDAGSRSTFNCVEAFIALGYSVTLWPDNLWRDPDYTPVYQAMGVEVIYGAEFQNGFTDFIRERADLYDAAFINRPHIAEPYIDALRQHTNAKVMFYGHDLHFQRLTRAMEIGENVTLDAIEAAREQELRVCSKADVVFYPDQGEVDHVSRAVGGKRTFLALPVVVFPTDTIGCSSRREARQAKAGNAQKLLFVGGFNHVPNRDGIIWFVNEVLPIVKREVGAVQLTIAGSKPPQEVIALENDGVTVTGFVTDAELERFYEDATLAIAPLRYGAGVKGKVIEALAKGVPLVTTPVGAQGLIDPDKILFEASSAAEFAAGVVTALTDRDQAAKRASAGTDYIRRYYSFEALQAMFRTLVEESTVSRERQ
jgi:GT2 family glycosyltransferase/SAM-dependent methyltransferase